ncbi:heparin lyase I family protein [Paenibacillus swuensis]|nr:heparin lyase I family protein [Paenibacillus swuensis]
MTTGGLFGTPSAQAALALPHWESFENGVANEFTTVSGTWFITSEGTQTYGAGYSTSLARVVAGESTWSNYSVESKVRVNYWGDPTTQSVGLMGRYTDADNYYMFTYEAPGELRIKKKNNSNLTILQSKAFTFNTNKWYTFRAEMNGSTIRFYVDGKLELEVQDTAFTSGKAGLLSVYGSSCFDDVRIIGMSTPSGTIIEYALDNLGTFKTVIQGTSSITNVSNPVRRGTSSFKHVTSGDPKRAEIDDDWTKYDAKTNSYYYGLSYFIPDDGTFTDTLRQIVGQLRFSNITTAPATKPNCEMSGHGGSGHHLTLWEGNWRYSLQHQDPAKASCAGLINKEFTLIPIKKGVWTDIVIHAKFRHTTDGFIKIWMAEDGGGYKQVLNYYGSTWFDKYQDSSSLAGIDVKAPNFTFGQYWSNSTLQRTNYTDQARVYQVSTSLDDYKTGFNMVRPEQ